MSFLDRCAQRFGDIFALRFPGSPPRICLSNPDELREMYTGPAEIFHAGEAAGSVFAPLTGWHCTLTLDGAAHLKRRELVQVSFESGRFEGYAETMYDVARTSIRAWPRKTTAALLPLMQDIALRIIFRTVLGLDDRDPSLAGFLRIVSRLTSLGMGSKLLLIPALRWNLGRYSPWGRVVRLVRDVDALVYDEISRRRSSPDATANDVLSTLMRAEVDGEKLSERGLRDEMIALLLAGHETTAVALTWTVERALAVSSARERLSAEVESIRERDGLDLTRINQLPYLDAFIKESLRFWSLSPICGGRVLKAPFTLRGYHLPPESVLVNCPYLLHRRPDLYAEPDAFLPERFMDSPPPRYGWTPFGGGVRRCMGRKFAQMEIKVTLAVLLSEARVRLATPRATPRAEGIHLLPARGLPVALG